MMKILSSEFRDGDIIPLKYTSEGENLNPPLYVQDVPLKTQSLVLIVDDPVEGVGGFVNWLVWNIPPETKMILPGSIPLGATEGVSSTRDSGYVGPCPPQGEDRLYFFKLYALNCFLNISERAVKAEVEQYIDGHIIESAVLIGRYKLQGISAGR